MIAIHILSRCLKDHNQTHRQVFVVHHNIASDALEEARQLAESTQPTGWEIYDAYALDSVTLVGYKEDTTDPLTREVPSTQPLREAVIALNESFTGAGVLKTILLLREAGFHRLDKDNQPRAMLLIHALTVRGGSWVASVPDLIRDVLAGKEVSDESSD